MPWVVIVIAHPGDVVGALVSGGCVLVAAAPLLRVPAQRRGRAFWLALLWVLVAAVLAVAISYRMNIVWS